MRELYLSNMKIPDSAGIKTYLSKALIEENGLPLSKSITQYKLVFKPACGDV